jgi:hypothetical protein
MASPKTVNFQKVAGQCQQRASGSAFIVGVFLCSRVAGFIVDASAIVNRRAAFRPEALPLIGRWKCRRSGAF